MITSEQIRGARAMLRIEQSELATMAQVSPETIERIERQSGPVLALAGTVDAIQKALESAGVEFVEEPEDRPYGIDAGFRDPSGNHIRLTQVKEFAAL